MSDDDAPIDTRSSASQAAHMILNEVGLAANYGHAALERAFELRPQGPGNGLHLISSNCECLDLIVRGLSYAATISRCISKAGRPKASNAEQRFHAARTKLVLAALDGVDVEALRDRTIRNSLEHIDEHIDRLFMKRPDRRPRTSVVHNLALSSRAAIDVMGQLEPFIFARVYVSDTDEFHNLGKTVRLTPVREALARVKQALSEPGGSVFA